jgi:hypothetical protein
LKLGDVKKYRTANDVAQWMFDEVVRRGVLDQQTAAYEIQRQFGKEHVYENENGNPAINKGVLTAFGKLTGDSIVWERGSREWRKRERYDKPGRQQD